MTTENISLDHYDSDNPMPEETRDALNEIPKLLDPATPRYSSAEEMFAAMDV